MAFLPVAVAVVFALIWWRDHTQGGYRAEHLARPIPLRVTQD